MTKKSGALRWAVRVAVVVAVLVTVGLAARRTFTIGGPHTPAPSQATLSEALEKEAREAVRKEPPRKMSQAIERALALTDRVLSYGAGHTPSYSFDVAPRAGTPEEYAQLFSKVLDTMLHELRINARTFVMSSAEARVLGAPLSLGGQKGHAWVFVQERRSTGTWLKHYVDPTLYELTGSWAVLKNVEEPADVPML